MFSSSLMKQCSTGFHIRLLTLTNGTKQVGTRQALFAIPQFQCVLSFTTVGDVISLQSGTSHVINATNQVKRVTCAVSYIKLFCTLLAMTANAATGFRGEY